MIGVFTWAGLRGGLGDYHYARTRPASRSMNAVRPCCVIEPSPGDPLVTARVHGALSAVPSNVSGSQGLLLLYYKYILRSGGF